jgi:2,3-bisphosphoglycerate-independent phosphoglycerate mutase
MTDRDLLIRINFATIDANGIVIDRRAGRIDNETNKRICRKLQENIQKLSDIEIIFEPVREYRALLTLRGDGLREEILETDPQKNGASSISPESPGSGGGRNGSPSSGTYQ